MQFFNVHTHELSLNNKNCTILNIYPNSTFNTSPFSIGIHPWYINNESLANELLLIESKLQHKNCFAIGECGLDKAISLDFEIQKIVFKKQILLSEKYKKPLLIHCVRAFQELLEIKNELNTKQVWIVHGFNKNIQIAKSLLNNNIYLSFGAGFLKSISLQEVFKSLPIENLLLETDNAPIDIKQIYTKASELKNISLAEFHLIIKQNFTNIFK